MQEVYKGATKPYQIERDPTNPQDTQTPKTLKDLRPARHSTLQHVSLAFPILEGCIIIAVIIPFPDETLH